MEGLFSYKSFDKKKDQEIDLTSQPDLLEQARQYYLTMTKPNTQTCPAQSYKTPQQCRTPQIQKSKQPQTSDKQFVADILTTNSQLEEQPIDTNQNSFEDQKSTNNRPSSGRRLRSQRVRGKTPTATQTTINHNTHVETFGEQNFMKNSFSGIQTMDDFANMLLAKHESNRQQSQVPQPVKYQTTEVKTNNLFTKVSYIVTVNDEDQSLPDVVSQVQMLDNSTLPLDDSDFNSSPKRDQIKPYTKKSPQKHHHEQISLEFAVQKVQITEDVSQEDSSYVEPDQEQKIETRQQETIDQQKLKISNNYGYLTSIKEFNESQENVITEQTTSPSHQVEFTSLRCDEIEQVELADQPEDSCRKFLAAQLKKSEESNQNKQINEDKITKEADIQCEENFGCQSPIKKFHVEENQEVRHNSNRSPSEYDSPDEEIKSDLNETNEELDQSLSCKNRKEEIEQSLKAKVDQLQTQLLQAQSTIGSLERQIQSKEIQRMQDQLRYEQVCQQLEMQNTQHELHVTQLIESNTQTTHKLHHDFEVKKQMQSEEHEKIVAYYKAALAQSQEQIKHYETTFKQRDQLTIKLRQDNQNMFADLKQLAQSEQHLKFELQDAKTVISELEAHVAQLTDSFKQQNQQFSEQLKNSQVQIELIKQQTNKTIKDTVSESEKNQKESQLREQQMMQEIQGLLEQNQLLANKAQSLEQERLNITTERERKNNELRQMHQELQKMTTVINGLKQMQMSTNQFELNGASSYFGQRGSSTGKIANIQTTPNQNQNQQRQVLHQTDLNQEWTNNQNFYQQAQQIQQIEARHQSPFKKSSITPHPISSPSPLKGRMDPNMAQYARRQNLNITNHQQDFESIVQEMSLADMQATKQKMEAEYARIPIILTGKSLQIRKRKEELEYELDLIEKYISRAKQNRL